MALKRRVVVKGRIIVSIALLFSFIVFAVSFKKGCIVKNKENIPFGEIMLPKPRYDSEKSIEHVLQNRRSNREFAGKSITLAQFSQLLWAAQGVTNDQGFRTAPSAGALYPMELYVVVGSVKGLDSGVYKYNCRKHAITLVRSGDALNELEVACLGQSCIGESAIAIVIMGVYARVRCKYGERAIRYVHIEAGHVSQNVCLQAVALGLATVTVGAFDDGRVQGVVRAKSDEEPLYVMPVGWTV